MNTEYNEENYNHYNNLIMLLNTELDILENMIDNNTNCNNILKKNMKLCKKCNNYFSFIKVYHNYCSLTCYNNR